MRTTCLLLLFMNFGFIYCIYSDINSFGSGTIEKCCNDAYGDNEDSKNTCLNEIQKGYAGSYIEDLVVYSVNRKERQAIEKILLNDPAYKGKLDGLKDEAKDRMIDELYKLPDVQTKAKMEADKAVKEEVDMFDRKVLGLCGYEKTILEGLKPDAFGFIVATATGQYSQIDVTKFTTYLAKLDESKLKQAMELTTSFWQKLYSNTSNLFDKVADYEDVVLTEHFKKFNDNYTKWYDSDLETCKIDDIVGMYKKHEEKIKTGKEVDYRSEIKAEIKTCSEAAKKAKK